MNYKTEMTKLQQPPQSHRSEKCEREVKRHGGENGTINTRQTIISDHNAMK